MTQPLIPPFAVKAGYQTSQYGTGNYSKGRSQVFSHLATPPSSGVSSENSSANRAKASGFSAYNASAEVQVITIVGAPTGGTFTLNFGGQTTTAIPFNAAATVVRNALGALSSIPHTSGVAEKQTINVTGSPTGGTFTLSFGGQTTSAIAYNATASTVQSVLTSLSSVGANNATVSGSAGGPFTITFAGSLVGPQSLISAVGSLTGGSSPSVSVVRATAGVTPAFAVAVSGNAGGPYTVTFQNQLATVNVDQIRANSSFTGGSSPKVTTSTQVNGTVAFANQALARSYNNTDIYKNSYDSQSGNHF